MNAPKDEDRLLDHNYDGITEYDNPLPRWWLWILWVSIIWSALYWLNVPGVGIGKGRIADYEADMAAATARFPAPAPTAGPTDEQILAQAADTAVLGRGKATFTAMCAACHGPDGGGVIGPNLTDDYWLHGRSPTAVHTTVANGVLAKGMPAWGKTLQPAELDAVVAYVISLHGTRPASPKPPEGDQDPPDAAPSGS